MTAGRTVDGIPQEKQVQEIQYNEAEAGASKNRPLISENSAGIAVAKGVEIY
jgi:hypothetical protein